MHFQDKWRCTLTGGFYSNSSLCYFSLIICAVFPWFFVVSIAENRHFLQCTHFSSIILVSYTLFCPVPLHSRPGLLSYYFLFAVFAILCPCSIVTLELLTALLTDCKGVPNIFSVCSFYLFPKPSIIIHLALSSFYLLTKTAMFS